jgi:aspartyl-tRNA(Asn)/glutamyl-tRNA(Gln) amidotransferase subunit C
MTSVREARQLTPVNTQPAIALTSVHGTNSIWRVTTSTHNQYTNTLHFSLAQEEKNDYNKAMKINVPHVAQLANLTLTPDEIKKFEKQLSEVLEYVKQLDNVDTKDVVPTSQVTGLEDVFREDTPTPSLPQSNVLSQAQAQHNKFFQVKGIFEEE